MSVPCVSQTHKVEGGYCWCVLLLFFFFSFLFIITISVFPGLSPSRAQPVLRPPAWVPLGPGCRCSEASAGGPSRAGPCWGTDCPPPRLATGDRGAAKAPGGVPSCLLRSYLTLVNCLSSFSASAALTYPRTRGSRKRENVHPHTAAASALTAARIRALKLLILYKTLFVNNALRLYFTMQHIANSC